MFRAFALYILLSSARVDVGSVDKSMKLFTIIDLLRAEDAPSERRAVDLLRGADSEEKAPLPEGRRSTCNSRRPEETTPLII
mmetsp:Transcript_5822/g.13086  ORF Transcript_5822/g.13086 Transcript_5822/m.13086 type:complete len:82 (+) Transcript_5822:286-531(+)